MSKRRRYKGVRAGGAGWGKKKFGCHSGRKKQKKFGCHSGRKKQRMTSEQRASRQWISRQVPVLSQRTIARKLRKPARAPVHRPASPAKVRSNQLAYEEKIRSLLREEDESRWDQILTANAPELWNDERERLKQEERAKMTKSEKEKWFDAEIHRQKYRSQNGGYRRRKRCKTKRCRKNKRRRSRRKTKRKRNKTQRRKRGGKAKGGGMKQKGG